jgi:hypothetical protein
MIYGWRTTKTEIGFKWTVYGFEYGKGEINLQTGTRATRAQAEGIAKKWALYYRRSKAAA